MIRQTRDKIGEITLLQTHISIFTIQVIVASEFLPYYKETSTSKWNRLFGPR